MRMPKAVFAVVLATTVSCATSEPGGNPGSAGTGVTGAGGTTGAAGSTGISGTTGAAGTGNPTGAAGTAGPTGTAGTTGLAGSTGTAGTVGAAGSGSVGSGGQSGNGSGGSSATGTAGTGTGSGGTGTGRGGSGSGAGSTGSGGSSGSGTPMPSAGCAKMSPRPANGKVTVTNDHIYDFPTSYDGTKPFPLLIAYHAAGNPIDQFEGMTNNTTFATNYVRAFPKSAGNEWVYNTDIAKALRVYDELMADYCIDKNRVFATGHSSGSQMIVQILGHKSDADHIHFRAVAPVAASDYGALSGPMPVMYIQGKMDSVRGNDGAGTVARFRTANMCGSTSMPYPQVMGCTSSGTTVVPGCIIYDGCKATTIWCSHNDPQYSGTSHGVPCFAIKAMYDFFTAMP